MEMAAYRLSQQPYFYQPFRKSDPKKRNRTELIQFKHGLHFLASFVHFELIFWTDLLFTS